MPMICPACAAPCADKQRFCGECGARLGEGVAAAAAPNAASPAGPADAVQTGATAAATTVAGAGERRDVSTLFADLTNYTGLSVELDAEDLHAIVRRYTQRVTATIHAYGGTVERYIGDSVMAIFGAPLAHGDDPLRAVRAALLIQTEVMPDLSRELGRVLQASIGISFGEVMFMLGQPGHPEGLAVVGEPVNLAARTQGQASPGEILMTEGMRAACGHLVRNEFFAEKALKGIPQPVKLHRVLGLVGPAREPRTPLLGRDREIALLREVAERCVKARRGGLLHLRGEPGIGKSRLLEELQMLGQQAGLAMHACAYLDFGLEQQLSGVAAIVASLLGIAGGDGVQARQAAVAGAAADGWLDGEDAPFAADVLRLPQGPADRALLDAMESASRQAAVRSFVLKLVARAARRQPLVIVIEDIHWMPAGELEQLTALCDLARVEALVVATASRIVGDPLEAYLARLDAPGLAFALNVGPITAGAARLIAQAFSETQLQWIDACVAQADGNPLFLEQLLRHAAESGTSNVPGSIHNVVLARLDRLAEGERRAAQCAAVIGQRFSLRLLRQLLRDPGYEPASLERAGIVKPQGADWMFAHALVQEGAYASLLHSSARALHREAADHYREADLILCAQHLDRAKDAEAPRAFRRAASEQLASFRFARVHELLARGIELAADLKDLGDLRLLEGRTLNDQGHIAESMACYRRVLAQAAGPGQRGRALLGLAMGMRMSDDLNGAFQALEQAEPLMQGVGADLLVRRSELHYLRGNLHFPRGEIDACLREHGLALELARQGGSTVDEARALSGLGDAHYARSRMRTAQGYFKLCMDLCQSHGFGRIEAANRFMVATVRMYMNELDGALQDALASAELGRRVGHLRAQTVSHLTAGWVHLLQARPDLADGQARLGLAAAGELGAPRFRAFLLEGAARVRLAQGDQSEAWRLIEEALALAQSLNVMRFIGPWIWGTRALVSQDPQVSGESLAQGQALIDAGCVGHNHFWFRKHAMESCLRHGDLDAAQAHAQRLEEHTAAEPTPWAELFIERTRALTALARAPDSPAAQQRVGLVRQAALDCGHVEASVVASVC